ncbi:MAG: hypothetical protein EZS28_046660, partial [Streblomastix strix]
MAIATFALNAEPFSQSNDIVVKTEEMKKYGWKDTSDSGMAELNRMLTKELLVVVSASQLQIPSSFEPASVSRL